MGSRRGAGPRATGSDAAMRWRWMSAGAALLCVLAGAGAAAAQLRDFHGSVTAVSDTSLTVRNAAGDVRRFAKPGKEPQVSGGRAQWGEIRVGDKVVVSWSMDDQPALAHHVHVVGSGSD